MHRISGEAEWVSVADTERNVWQQVAAATSGVVTIGNFFSLLGLASVPLGLWLIIGREQHLLGALVLAVGRLGDVLDGWAADKTGTKSPLGELLDASFDKISIIVTVVALLIATVIPWWALVIWATPHLINSVFALAAWRQNRRLHPSSFGKISTATGWMAMLTFVVSAHFNDPTKNVDFYSIATGIALGLLAVTAILGLVASVSYIRDYFKGSR